MGSKQDDVIEMAALGRAFQLGMLYNLGEEELIPGATLWSHSEIQKNKSVTPKHSTEFSATGSESTEDKAMSLNLDLSLQLSVIFGLITGCGSAEYFMATKKSHQDARLTLKYHTTTRFEQLTMDHLAISSFQTVAFKNTPATHVVIAVLYGANAFFTFDREITKEESEEKTKGNMQLAVNVLSYVAKGMADAALTLGDRANKQLQNVTCSFYGDFKLDVNPSTFEDAVRVYSTLPSMLGKDGEYAVPLKVWLYPLSRLGLTNAPRVTDISSSCSRRILHTLNQLDMVDLKCDHLLNEGAQFPVTHNNINDLKQTCLNYKNDLKEKILPLLKLVRNGVKEKEKDIDDILEHHMTSLFRSSYLNQWLTFKEEEIHTVKATLKQLQEIGVDLLTDEDTENAAHFTFTSLEQPDPFLSQLSDYRTDVRPRVTTVSPQTWLTEEVKGIMRSKLKLFKKLKNSISTDTLKFAASLKHHEKHPGACIMVYGDEYDGAVCFTPPCKPTCSVTDPVTDYSVTVKLSPACESTVTRNLEYKMKQHEEWKCQPVPQDREEITIAGLDADTVYEMRCTEVGILEHTSTSDVITFQTKKMRRQTTKPSTDRTVHPLQYSNPTAKEATQIKGQGVITKNTAMQTEHDSPSHVVRAVLYGSDAYFTSEEGILEKTKKQISEGEIKLNFHRHGGVRTGSGKAMIAPEKFSCTFSGDFNLPANIPSITDVINLYTTLPNTLKEKEEKAVPLRLWLYPQCKLESNTARLVRDIHSSLVTHISDIIESLNIAEQKCCDLINDTVAQTFPGFCTKIQGVKKECRCYKFEMIRRVGSLLPSICQCENESALSEFLIRHEESPFNTTTLDKWLKVKDEECSLVKSFLQELQDIGVDQFNHVSDPETDVVCFAFTSLDQPDHFQSQLSDCVKSVIQDRVVETWLTEDVKQRMKDQLQLFKKLKTSRNSEGTKFTVLSKHHDLHPGACVMLYERGSKEAICFTPPCKPICSAAGAVTDSSVTVTLSSACADSVKRNLQYKVKQEEEWTLMSLELDAEKIALTNLKADTVYEIKCTTVGQLEYTVTSEIITIQTLKEMHPPTDLRAMKITSSSVLISWSCPMLNSGRLVKGFIVEYKENSNQWLSIKASTEDCVFSLDSLTHDTSYVIRISTDCGETGVSDPSEELLITTKRDWIKIIEDAHQSCSLLSEGPPSVYTLNLKRVDSGQISKFSFGVPSPLNQENKTIMLFGATGSGKTTLINGMINYILGVDWEDDYRFKLINEVTSKTHAESQTEEVTAYHIHHMKGFKIPYSLTIIDTPGFGHTRGIRQDEAITDQIRSCLCHQDGIASIDAVCFVVQSSLPRLTSTQKYILQSILSLFGKDIGENIVILVTFADGQTPPVLEGLKSADIQCAKNNDGSPLHFKFNNSALFASDKWLGTGDHFGQMFWKMGKQSMERFFSHLNLFQTQSLQLTKEVLEERRQLEVSIKRLQTTIQDRLAKLDKIKQTKAALEHQQSLIDANKDFEYEVELPKVAKVDISGENTFVTNCLSCNYTCHYPCAYAKDEEKENCIAMTDGFCTVCPGKCIWNQHNNMQFKFEINTVRENRTYENLKHQYEAACGEKKDAVKLKNELEADYKALQSQILSMVEELTRCLKRLKEIALQADPLSTTDYIDLLIESEEQEATPGFQKRISELQHIRQQAVILQKVIRCEDLI
ncbi:uncharacterized protein LOC143509945 [Brachyhypopomus gauderio]|uniref:uncharacterized protein LOC143509945 n=1 Tax=Brachyhypopomus gauderio TaxID=698409 RepID=UPI00404273CE